MGFIPATRSGVWWKWGGIGAVFITIMLCIVQFVALGKAFEGTYVLRYLVISLLLAYLCAFTGWIGAKALFGCAAAGIVVGLILMLWYSRGMSGWEELAGLVSFGMAVVAGFAVGLLAEIILWAARKIRDK